MWKCLSEEPTKVVGEPFVLRTIKRKVLMFEHLLMEKEDLEYMVCNDSPVSLAMHFQLAPGPEVLHWGGLREH